MTQHWDMSATQMYPKISEEGFLGSTYTKTGKVLTTTATATLQLSSWLIFSLGKSIILVIGVSPSTDRNTLYHRTVCKLFELDRNTWYRITACKLFVVDKNTWNYTTLHKLFVLDRITWYHKCPKTLKKQLHQKFKYERFFF